MAIKNTKQKILPKTLPSPTAPRTRTWLFNFPAWRGAARGKNSVCLWAKGKKLMCARGSIPLPASAHIPLTWILSGTPVLSIRLETFTVFPQMSYCGFRAPMTPATTGPMFSPVVGRAARTETSGCSRVSPESHPTAWNL